MTYPIGTSSAATAPELDTAPVLGSEQTGTGQWTQTSGVHSWHKVTLHETGSLRISHENLFDYTDTTATVIQLWRGNADGSGLAFAGASGPTGAYNKALVNVSVSAPATYFVESFLNGDTTASTTETEYVTFDFVPGPAGGGSGGGGGSDPGGGGGGGGVIIGGPGGGGTSNVTVNGEPFLVAVEWESSVVADAPPTGSAGVPGNPADQWVLSVEWESEVVVDLLPGFTPFHVRPLYRRSNTWS